MRLIVMNIIFRFYQQIPRNVTHTEEISRNMFSLPALQQRLPSYQLKGIDPINAPLWRGRCNQTSSQMTPELMEDA